MKVVSFRLEEEKAKELGEMAEGQQRTTGSMLRHIVYNVLLDDRLERETWFLIQAAKCGQLTRQELDEKVRQIIDRALGTS